MTEKQFQIIGENYTNIDIPVFIVCREDDCCFEVYESKEETQMVCDKLNKIINENEQLKKELKRCRNWLNSDKNDYNLTLAFIKNKGYSLKDVLEYEKRLQE